MRKKILLMILLIPVLSNCKHSDSRESLLDDFSSTAAVEITIHGENFVIPTLKIHQKDLLKIRDELKLDIARNRGRDVLYREYAEAFAEHLSQAKRVSAVSSRFFISGSIILSLTVGNIAIAKLTDSIPIFTPFLVAAAAFQIVPTAKEITKLLNPINNLTTTEWQNYRDRMPSFEKRHWISAKATRLSAIWLRTAELIPQTQMPKRNMKDRFYNAISFGQYDVNQYEEIFSAAKELEELYVERSALTSELINALDSIIH